VWDFMTPSCAQGSFMCSISFDGVNLRWCCPNTDSCYDGATFYGVTGMYIVYCVCPGG
jgi:hypothetical protein